MYPVGSELLHASISFLNFVTGASVKFAIESIPTIAVGKFGKVSVNALDQYGNVAFSENRDVEAVASGYAIGAGTVSIQNGAGFFYITDQTIENVTISLLDSFATGLDVSSTQVVSFVGGLNLLFSQKLFLIYFPCR